MSIHRRELWKYEYQRFFTWKLWGWIGLCFFVNLALLFCKYREREPELLYKEIAEQYEGISTKEKISDICEKTAYYEQVLDNHSAVLEEYARGKVNDEEFRQFMKDYKYARRYIHGWLRLEEHAGRFEEQEKKTCFFYEIAWKKLFQNNVDWVFVFLVITLLIPYFYLDRDSNWCSIGESYVYYQTVERYRCGFAVTVILILQIMWIVSELAVILSVSSLPDALSTACSLAECSKVRESVSLLQFYVFRNLLILVRSAADVFLLDFMSKMIRNKIQTTVIFMVYLIAANYYIIDCLKWILK